MKKIQMVDLKTQYESIQEEINQAVFNVVRSTAYINGPEVKAFQEKLEDYLNVQHIIPCANGTDALQIALMALDLKPGDEVITSDFTFAATVEVIELLQLKSVLVDVYPDTFNIDVDAIERVITPKTKAIIPVHLFGQCADMESIMNLAKKHNLYVVEDTAQAIGAEYIFSDGKKQKAGTIGDIGTTSFFPSKNLGGYGDGGALFSNSYNLAAKIRSISNHGMHRRYYHDKVGVNSRLDSIQAAILRVKLPHLDRYNKTRREAADAYDQAFKNCSYIEIPFRNSGKSNHVFHQYTLKLKNVDRNYVQKQLMEKDIPAMIYYPIPLHRQEAYKGGGHEESHFPVTNQLVNEVISLPMHTELDEEQINWVTGSLLACL